MTTKRWILPSLMLAALLAVAFPGHAQTIRIASQADVLSMDPHSLNESLQLSTTGNVYESLISHAKDLSLAPALATAWKQQSPTVWKFDLRKDVTFQDGTPFTADDVLFSFERAQRDGSDMRTYTSTVKQVRKIDDHTVEIETLAPFPLLPDALTQVAMMSRTWCEANQAESPADVRTGETNGAFSRANGTGPFTLQERQPGVRTVFKRNTHYWGTLEGNVQEVVWTPIRRDTDRVAALLSGAVDVMEPVPAQDAERLEKSPGIRLIRGPELRTLFLGMDQQRDELLYSNIKGKNPFKDVRVRRAFYEAIDIEGIKKSVMRGASNPSAMLVGPGINGFNPDIKRLPYDPAHAKKLLVDAGYPEGFEVTLDCPSDRYVSDERICQAVAANLARIQVQVKLDVQPKAAFFPKVLRRDTSFYLLGWTPMTYDAESVISALMVCPDDKGAGPLNLGGYCNPQLDTLSAQIQAEPDKNRRNALLQKALALETADIGYLPLHQQALAWGVSDKVKLVQRADNSMPFKWMSISK